MRWSGGARRPWRGEMVARWGAAAAALTDASITLSAVMAGLGPATHDFGTAPAKSWVPGTGPGMTRGGVDAQPMKSATVLCAQSSPLLASPALPNEVQPPST